jgi:hypothetical protein
MKAELGEGVHYWRQKMGLHKLSQDETDHRPSRRGGLSTATALLNPFSDSPHPDMTHTLPLPLSLSLTADCACLCALHNHMASGGKKVLRKYIVSRRMLLYRHLEATYLLCPLAHCAASRKVAGSRPTDVKF